MLDTSRLGAQLTQQHLTCTVLDIPSGNFPKIILVRLPTSDGPAQQARWFGSPQIVVGDVVICRRDPNDNDVLVVEALADQVSSVFDTMINQSGGTLAENDCVVTDVANTNSVTTTVTEGDLNAPAIVIVGADDGDEVQVKRIGLVSVVLNAAGAIGDYIRTATTAKRVDPVSELSAGCFGQLIEAGNSSDTVRAVLF